MCIFAPICSVEANVAAWNMMMRPSSYECHDTSRNLTCYVEKPLQRFAPETMMPVPTTAPTMKHEEKYEAPRDVDGRIKWKWGFCMTEYKMTWIRTYHKDDQY